MADTVSQRTEDLVQHFEGFEDIQHLARVLADNGELRVDVRSQGYACLLSKFVDVSELVDFGPGSNRRGHFDFKGLKEQKRRGVEKTEWLGVGCTSTSDLIDGYSFVAKRADKGKFRDARYFHETQFKWDDVCTFSLNGHPCVTTRPLAFVERAERFVILHCEWIGENGLHRENGRASVATSVWVGIWQSVEWMLVVLRSRGKCMGKPVYICAGAYVEVLEEPVVQHREYPSVVGEDWPDTEVNWDGLSGLSGGRMASDVHGEVEPVNRAGRRTWKRVQLELNRAATGYENVVLPHLGGGEDYGLFYEEGQEPNKFQVGVHVYCPGDGWIGPLSEIDPKDNDRVKVQERWTWVLNEQKEKEWTRKLMKRTKWLSVRDSRLVVAPVKGDRLEEMRMAAGRPIKGSLCFIATGSYSNLVGRKVKVDNQTTNAKCAVHWFENGEKKKKEQLVATSLIPLEGSGEPILRVEFAELSLKETKLLNIEANLSAETCMDVVKSAFDLDEQGWGLVRLNPSTKRTWSQSQAGSDSDVSESRDCDMLDV